MRVPARWMPAALTAIGIGLFVISAVSTAARPAPPCGPASARTLASDRVARVYRSRDTVFGCAAGHARRYVIGRRGGGFTNRQAAVGLIRLAGTVVAWSATQSGVDTASTTVWVRRLTDGHVLVQRPATTRIGVEGFASVGSLVVRRSGAVAWIGVADSIGPPRRVRQVERVDRRGFAVLESSLGIASGSLRLRGSVLSWRSGGRVRRAGLD
jgi:hypothetical protein